MPRVFRPHDAAIHAFRRLARHYLQGAPIVTGDAAVYLPMKSISDGQSRGRGCGRGLSDAASELNHGTVLLHDEARRRYGDMGKRWYRKGDNARTSKGILSYIIKRLINLLPTLEIAWSTK